MKKNKMVSFLVGALLLSAFAYGQKNAAPVDYLHVPGPISFDMKAYYLDWSSHPSANYYKHEYLRKGDTTGHFSSMLMIDVLTGPVNIKEVVAAKIKELENIKKTNPVAQYETFQNTSTGEYMIDFLVTQNTPDGKDIAIAEHNVYRYKSFTDKKGKKGLMLFALSTRSYGDNINAFLILLKTTKRKMVDNVLQFKLPAIEVK